jgi:hypothetical protein
MGGKQIFILVVTIIGILVSLFGIVYEIIYKHDAISIAIFSMNLVFFIVYYVAQRNELGSKL